MAFAGHPQAGYFIDAAGIATGLGQYVHRAAGILFAIALIDAAVDARGQEIGRLVDVIVHLPGANSGPAAVTGLVAVVGRRRVFVPADTVAAWHAGRVELWSATVDLREFERRDGEVLGPCCAAPFRPP